MSLTTKYALVGLLWGLVLGYGVVAIATGLGVAVLFTVVYGDGPWGEGAGGVLYGLAALGWVGSAVFCAGVGYVHGWRVQRQGARDEGLVRVEHRRAHLLAAAAVLTALLGGYQLYARNAALVVRQGHLDVLLQARHALSTLEVVERHDGFGLDVVVGASGHREGRYRLEVSVRDERGRTLHVARTELDAGAHEIHERVPVPYGAIVPAQGGSNLENAGGDGPRQLPLVLTARLTPLLGPGELRVLPGHVARNYMAEDSPFHSTLQVSHVLRWRAAGGRRWIVGRDGEVRELVPDGRLELALVEAQAVSIRTIRSFSAIGSFSSTHTSMMVPSQGDGMSRATLPVSSMIRVSSRWTVCPTATSTLSTNMFPDAHCPHESQQSGNLGMRTSRVVGMPGGLVATDRLR